MKPFSSFLAIHFEVGRDTRGLDHQRKHWPAAVSLVESANKHRSKLTLQFNPQWADYILADKVKFDLLKKWQDEGHEISLHHHGYDHNNWNGYTNRSGKSSDYRYRGTIKNMMGLMTRLAAPYDFLSGTITDEAFDYPDCIRYDTEGIWIHHARTRPQKVIFCGIDVIQVGMALLPFDGDIEVFKQEYLKSQENNIFGVVTHEADYDKDPAVINKWLEFMQSENNSIQTVSEILADYQKTYPISYNEWPLTFLNCVANN